MQARALKFLFSVDNVDRKMLLVSRTRMIATVAAGGGIRERELAAELRRAARPPPLALRHARRAAAAAPLPAATTYYLAAEPFIICPFIFIDLTTLLFINHPQIQWLAPIWVHHVLGAIISS